MIEMTLPSRHRIPKKSEAEHALGHGGSPQYWVLRVDGENLFSLKPPGPVSEPRTLEWNYYPVRRTPIQSEAFAQLEPEHFYPNGGFVQLEPFQGNVIQCEVFVRFEPFQGN